VRLSLIGDVHGNLIALEAVLETLARKDALGALLVVGDIVGYGPDPGPCVSLLREHALLACLGNHDAAACGRLDPRFFNPTARFALDWTQNQLEAQTLDWLSGLPLVVMHAPSGWTLSHSGLWSPADYPYIMGAGDALPTLELMRSPFCAFGHTHIPIVYFQPHPGGPAEALPFSEGLLLLPGRPGRVLLNGGSVGQPRDGDPRACAAIFDRDQGAIELLRVPYDARATRKRIQQAGLPAFLGDRLLEGY